MDIFWKTIGASLVTVILALSLERQGKDFSLLITLSSAVMIAMIAAKLLEPATVFFSELESLGDLNSKILLILLKIFGVGFSGEIAASVCVDAGNSAIGKGLLFLTNAAILYLSIPVFTSFIDLIRQIIGNV